MKNLMLVLGFLITAPVWAQAPGPVERVDVPGVGRVPYQMLFEERSLPGESRDAFVLRLADRMRRFSEKTGFEACGVLGSDGVGFGVIVGTNNAHAGCANFHAKVPEGMTSTRLSVHSHIAKSTYTANRADRMVLGPLAVGKLMNREDPEAFSDEDKAGGPGYLVSPKSVWRFDGTDVHEVR